MTVEECYAKISQNMVKGLMIHSQMSEMYYFLGLEAYGDMHKCQFLEESEKHSELNKFYILRMNRLLPNLRVEDPKVFSENWYKYTRDDVDTNTICNGVKESFDLWVKWEKDTKQLYSNLYSELLSKSDYSLCEFVKGLICAVDEELCKAESMRLSLKAADYDINYILGDQVTIE